MHYISTRGNVPSVTAARAIREGMVSKGGLYVPERIPALDPYELQVSDYCDLARRILTLYLGDFSDTEIEEAVQKAYGEKQFDHPLIAPMRYLDDETAVLELWHGPTAAFKDMALQIMPRLLTISVQKLGEDREIVILVATSGDTGKAALEGYRDVSGTRIIVFYPAGGVSRMQELQMLTTTGQNTMVVGVEGNFDDCQNMVKKVFQDTELREALHHNGMEFSSANSINWGRLLPQIVYYYWAYLQMVTQRKIINGDIVNIAVPTGNFGNILAAYYAGRMGLPVGRLICASNRNNILTDFIQSGIYDLRREFHKTMSPSMDILISSNLERFLFELTGHNALKISRWYEELARDQKFRVDDSTRQHLKNILYAGFAGEEETGREIRRVYNKYHYVMDTHTAVGSAVCEQYRAETGDRTPVILASTASPYKFAGSVYQAVQGGETPPENEALLQLLAEKTGTKVHPALQGLESRPVLHHRHIQPSQIQSSLREWLEIKS